MQVPTVDLNGLSVSRFIIGGNPFSGFSHQSQARTDEMVAWYTDERIVETLFQAESLGLNTCILRGDNRVARVLRRYWDEGGAMRWVAQSAAESQSAAAGAQFCIDHGASACFLHGGLMDHYVAQERYDDIRSFVETVRAAELSVGVAGHMPGDFVWAEENLALDFYMVCYYNPSPRQEAPQHDRAAAERYSIEDRDERVATLQGLSRPAIHYKILAAGRTDPVEAFGYAAAHMRPSDAVCVGIYTKDDPNMLETDIRLLLDGLRAVGQ
jgi:hypothetical protein